MAGCLERKGPVGEPGVGWVDAVGRDAVDLPPMRKKWKAGTRKREGWWQKVGQALARRRTEAPYYCNNNNTCLLTYLLTYLFHGAESFLRS